MHLNLPFREPLMPSHEAEAAVPPIEHATDAGTNALPDRLPAFLREVSTGHRILVVAGGLRVPPARLIDLCAVRRWPLLAEPLSGLRDVGRGPHRGGALSAGAMLAADAGFRAGHHPDLIIQVGAAPTSRGVQELIRSADRLLIIDPDHRIADPDRRAALTVESDPAAVVAALDATTMSLPATRPQWFGEWYDADRTVRAAVDALLELVGRALRRADRPRPRRVDP